MIHEFTQGQIVRVVHLARGSLIMASSTHLNARLEGAVGKVVSVIRSDGEIEDVVWVHHSRATAPYLSYELVLVGVPCADN